jgi:hypothetical protein
MTYSIGPQLSTLQLIKFLYNLNERCTVIIRARGSVVVKPLCYNPEGRGFDTRRGDFLNLPNPSSRTRPWGLFSL